MKSIFLDLSPSYIPFIVQCTKSVGDKIDPTVDNLIIYEEGGADAVFDSGQITGSPFDPAKVNSKTGLWGILVPKSALTAGKWYIALWEMTVNGVATAKVEKYFVCNASQFKADVSGLLTSSAFDAKIGNPAGASVSADVAAVKGDTAAILDDTGTSGVVVPQAQADKVWSSASRTLTSFGTLVSDIWNAVTRSLTDKSGFSLDASERVKLAASQTDYAPSKAGDAMALTSDERTTLTASVWNALLSGLTTVGSIGKKLADWVIGTTQTADVATRPTLADIEGSSVLAKQADVLAIKSDISLVQQNLHNGHSRQDFTPGIAGDGQGLQVLYIQVEDNNIYFLTQSKLFEIDKVTGGVLRSVSPGSALQQMVSDGSNIYIIDWTSPPRIRKIAISSFTEVGAYVLVDDGNLDSITYLNGKLFAGHSLLDGSVKVYKIEPSTMTLDAISVAYLSDSSHPLSMSHDGTNIYVGIAASSNGVIKIDQALNLLDSNLAAGALNVNVYYYNGTLFVVKMAPLGSQSSIIKMNPSDLSIVETLTLEHGIALPWDMYGTDNTLLITVRGSSSTLPALMRVDIPSMRIASLSSLPSDYLGLRSLVFDDIKYWHAIPTVPGRMLCTILTGGAPSSALLAESGSHPTLAEIEASAILAKEATLNTKASQASVDAVDNYVDTEIAAIIQHLVDIKGAGWTNETLKAIKEYVDELESRLTAQRAANLDNLDVAVSTRAAALIGTRSVTITIYKQGTTTPVPDYTLSIYNSNESALIGKIATDSNGQAAFNINDGTYKIRGVKAGWMAVNPVETLIVDGNETRTYYANEFSIGTPSSINTCRVYEWCFLADDATPMTAVTAEAKIINLPYDYDGKLHSGDVIAKTYDPVTGKLYWDIVWGAIVELTIESVYPSTVVITVPEQASARVKTLAG